MTDNDKLVRFTVTLDQNDMTLLLQLQAVQQQQLNKRISSAEIVRIAIRELALRKTW